MASQDSHFSGATRRNRRAALFLVALFALSVGVICYGAHWYHANSRAQLLRETTQSMDAQAYSKAALLTVWAGNLVDQIHAFVSQDMLRLFASEANETHIPAREFLRLAQEQDKASAHAGQSVSRTAKTARPWVRWHHVFRSCVVCLRILSTELAFGMSVS